jgi:CheY-like chemotaxis protein
VVASGAPDPKKRAAVPPSNQEKISVLFVDDNVEVLDSFGRYLQTSGLDVTMTTDPWAAIAKARDIMPHVIVLDVAMPSIDGYAVVDALQQGATRQIPVVLFTGLPASRLQNAPGVYACVQKPCTPEHLLGVVRMFRRGGD